MSAPHRCPDELRHRAFDGYLEKLKGVFEQTPFLPQCQPIFDLMGEGAETELRAIAIGMALTALPDDDREIAAVILEHAGAHRFAEITREAST